MDKTARHKVEPAAREADELAQLKQLLFADEAATLEALRRHVLDERQRVEDVAEVLPASIEAAAVDKSRLVKALNDPVDECIRSLIHRDPKHFADALFPVIGPAIRKSITETLRSFLQSMNEMLEQSLSVKALRWRWEARRTGVPFSEIVLKNSLLYRVDEVYLIQQQTGLLIEHLSHPDIAERDNDAISAMLTVIRDFSRDSFSAGPFDTLSTVEIGDRTLWIFDGPAALLACIIHGVIPESARADFQATLEKLHSQYPNDLESFDGDRSRLPYIRPLLANCLTQQSRQEPSEKRGSMGHFLTSPAAAVLLLALCLVGYLIWQHHTESQRLASLRADLEKTPGVVVINVHKEGGKLLVDGLVDPIAAPLDEFAVKHGLGKDDVRFNMSSYYSLDTPIALTRARKLLRTPNTVELSVNDAELIVTGIASKNWIRRAETLEFSVPGFSRIDLTDVEVDEQTDLDRIRKLLNPPETVKLRLIENTFHLSGTASYAWIKGIDGQQLNRERIKGQPIAVENDLIALEWIEASRILDILNTTSVYFSDGIDLTPEGLRSVERASADLSKLLKYAALLGAKINVILTGHVDGLGSVEFNQAIKMQRAEAVKQRFLEKGLVNLPIKIAAGDSIGITGQHDQALRRVDLSAVANTPKWTATQ